jgi:crossover junction endodeoxyribonuclease RusA
VTRLTEAQLKARSQPRRVAEGLLIPFGEDGAVEVSLPYPPSNNEYKRHYCTVDNRHKIGVYHREPAKQFLRDVAAIFEGAGEPLSGLVSVFIHVYRPRRLGDIDNVLKVLLDALQGKAYVNDSQIVELSIRRFEDKVNPRVEVKVIPVWEGKK